MNEISIDSQDKEGSMPTTHLFVELLVIGFGALLWVVMFVAALFGFDDLAVAQWSRSVLFLLPMTMLAYVLGIVIDRLADRVFEGWDKRHLRRHFGSNIADYYTKRRILVIHGHDLWSHLEYGRSRLRICRGWAVNALLLFVAMTSFFFTQRPPQLSLQLLVVINSSLLLLCFGCIASWRTLNLAEYRKIDRQSDWIAEMRKREDHDPPAASTER